MEWWPEMTADDGAGADIGSTAPAIDCLDTEADSLGNVKKFHAIITRRRTI